MDNLITMKREARNQHHQKTDFTYETAYAEGVKANPVEFLTPETRSNEMIAFIE